MKRNRNGGQINWIVGLHAIFLFDTIFQNPMFECVWCLKSMRILCLLLFLSWSKLSFEMFWEIIGASLGAARRRHPRPCLGISWHCLEGRERTAGGLLGIYMVPEMDDGNMKQRIYKVYIFKITSLVASCCHRCIGRHDCHGCHGRTQDTCYILLHCCCELRTRMTPQEANDAQEADDDEDEAGFKIQRWLRMVDIVA